MRHARTGRRRAVAVLALAAAAALAGSAGVPGADPPAPAGAGTLKGWSSLTLGAEKALIFSASAVLTVAESTHAATGRSAIVFKTHSIARLLGATGFEEETTSWIDREKARPIEFFQMRPADGARRYLFLDGLVRQTTWEPPAGDAAAKFERWRELETSDRRFTFSDGTGPKPGEALTDFYSLIYLLRSIDLADPSVAPREFTTIYRRHLVRVRVVPGERREARREAVNETTGSPEVLDLRERRVKIKPLGEDSGSFRGLLGMQGDTEIWVDEASGALLEVDGEAPGLGPTEVKLTSFRR